MPRPSAAVYDRWARHYDRIYEGIVDYEGDVDFLQAVFRRFRQRPKTILDLACGTGNHAVPLVRRGYDVTGIDRSAAMLSVARQKAHRVDPRPRFVRAEMQSFQLGRTYDAAICMFGAFGYLLQPQDSTRFLCAVRRHLQPHGLFVFEYWQTSAVRPGHQSWLDCVSEEVEILRLSDNRFDSRTSRLGITFRFFVLRGRQVVDRFSEDHVVRTYSRQEMDRLLRKSGFRRLGEFAGTPENKRFQRATPDAFRIMAVARPRGES